MTMSLKAFFQRKVVLYKKTPQHELTGVQSFLKALSSPKEKRTYTGYLLHAIAKIYKQEIPLEKNKVLAESVKKGLTIESDSHTVEKIQSLDIKTKEAITKEVMDMSDLNAFKLEKIFKNNITLKEMGQNPLSPLKNKILLVNSYIKEALEARKNLPAFDLSTYDIVGLPYVKEQPQVLPPEFPVHLEQERVEQEPVQQEPVEQELSTTAPHPPKIRVQKMPQKEEPVRKITLNTQEQELVPSIMRHLKKQKDKNALLILALNKSMPLQEESRLKLSQGSDQDGKLKMQIQDLKEKNKALEKEIKTIKTLTTSNTAIKDTTNTTLKNYVTLIGATHE